MFHAIARRTIYLERGRLSGAVDAQQSEALASAHAERQAVHCRPLGSSVNLPVATEIV